MKCTTEKSIALLKKTALQNAKRDSTCWPFTSLECHKKTLRRLAAYKKSSGGWNSSYEWSLAYEAEMSLLINKSA